MLQGSACHMQRFDQNISSYAAPCVGKITVQCAAADRHYMVVLLVGCIEAMDWT